MSSTEPPSPTPRPVQAPTRKRKPRERVSRIEFGSVLGASFSTWIKNFVPFTLLAILASLPNAFFLFVIFRDVSLPPLGLSVTSRLVEVLCSLLLQSTIVYSVFAQLRGNRASLATALSRGLRSLLAVAGAFLLLAMMFVVPLLPVVAAAAMNLDGLAAVLSMAAGVALAMIFVATYVMVPACVMEGLGPVAAIKRSFALTRGIRWSILAIHVVLSLIGGIAVVVLLVPFAIGLGLDGDIESAEWMQFALGVLLSPLLAIPPVIVYHDARRSKEGLGTDEIAAVFD